MSAANTVKANVLPDALREVPTATAKQMLAKLGVHSVDLPGLRPLSGGRLPVAGRARTLRYLPLREDLSAPPNGPVGRRAIEALMQGDILVIDAMGRRDGAVLGDMMGARAHYLGAGAVVADGVVRDLVSLRSLGLPVFALGTSPDPSAATMVPWEMDVPIQCRGRLVHPGDVILADEDSVLVIPVALAGEVASLSAKQAVEDELSQQRLRDGATLDAAYPARQR
jgi:regulator of RNase E activity RraA